MPSGDWISPSGQFAVQELELYTEIRLATPEDAAAVLEIYAPYVLNTHISFETEPPSLDTMRKRMETIGTFYPWLILESGGETVGYAYACPLKEREAYRWSPEVAVYIREGFHRRGAARALYTSLFAVLRRMNICNAVAIIALPNEPSVRFHEALGFQKVAHFSKIGFKLGQWRDTGHWVLRLSDPETPPKPVISIRTISSSPGFESLFRTGVKP